MLRISKNPINKLCLLLLFVWVSACGQQKDNESVSKKSNEPESLYSFPLFQPYIGDMGGMLIRIPYNACELIDYNGDESTEKNPLQSSYFYESKFNYIQFIFDYKRNKFYRVPFIQKDKKDYPKEDMLSTTTWVTVSFRLPRINAQELLRRYADTEINTTSRTLEKSEDKPFGLEYYMALDDNRKPLLSIRGDVFFAKDDKGNLLNFIECANGGIDVPRPPCSHYFVLKYGQADIWVELAYSRHQLFAWREIEDKASKWIKSFEVKH